MIFRHYLHEDPISISYLFGCGSKSEGIVLDRVGDVEWYIREAQHLHTPGHTPEHISLLGTDLRLSEAP
ncbi:hypothetical protein [Alicyclobacillus acidocaldarius]|uniref:Beta-lactamase domain protein n=1 Tax=Alicyclobacillus acidocaldarius (strain Tc-4-1) TaxID=1048834 RepID=F8IJU1_ALIAT|nr:hypothetical protein [Alicyclobacillus acidocaldarius]AEJ42280.1 beta-lactamase domain protein [Alicyclobacillus acidocaldarius subsp. acidocaldarius Tc-4-1]